MKSPKAATVPLTSLRPTSASTLYSPLVGYFLAKADPMAHESAKTVAATTLMAAARSMCSLESRLQCAFGASIYRTDEKRVSVRVWFIGRAYSCGEGMRYTEREETKSTNNGEKDEHELRGLKSDLV